MVEINLMYKLYIEHINFKVKKSLEENKSLESSHKQLQELIQSYDKIISLYTNTTVKKIFILINEQSINNIKFPTYSIYDNGKKINFKAIRLYIEKYIWYNRIIIINKNKININKAEIISFKLYKKILSSFNLKIIDQIVDNNYSLNLVPSFGEICIIKNENHKKRVNWGDSIKTKNEILQKGGIPYLKEKADKDSNYKGEKWLKYFPTIDFFYHWKTKWISKNLNPFLKDYKFTPARGVSSMVSKLKEAKQDRDRAFKLYTRILN